MTQNFKLDVDADGIALVTWDMPGRSMNVIDAAVIEELGDDRRAGRDRCGDQGRGHHLRQGHVLRRRRSHDAGDARPHGFADAAQGARARKRRAKLCSRKAASCRCSTAPRDLRQAVGRGASTAPRSAAASSWRSPATIASRPRIRGPGSACPRSRSGCSPAPAARSASRACCRPRMRCSSCSRATSSASTAPRRMKLIDAVVPAADLDQRRRRTWIKAGAEGQAAVGHRRLPAARRPGLFQGRHDDLPGRQRDLPHARPTTTIRPRARSCRCVYEGLQLPFDTALRVESR